MEDQRPPSRPRLSAFDLCDEKRVVAGLELGADAATEPGDGPVELGRPVACVAKRDLFPQRDRRHPAREVLGQRLLSRGEHADRQPAGVADDFVATVSSEEVPRGKPAPDVYLEAARRLDVSPTEAAAIEDSHNGIVSAKAAGMRVLAIPNRRFPPGEDALAQADVVLRSPAELTTEAVSPAD